MPESRIYVYKIVVDAGGAPCLDGDIWSLEICKPAIHRIVREGDVVFAFGSNSDCPANRLVYIANVTKRVDQGRYYRDRKFRARREHEWMRSKK